MQVIKGNLGLKIPNPAAGGFLYPAAWAWKVRAWQLLGSVWINIGASSVAADGSWSIDFLLPPFANQKVRIKFQPANRFVQVQDANANIDTWGDNWDQSGNVTNIGNRLIDMTANGYAPGIDSIYQSANTLATGKCTSTDGNNQTIPWNCSYQDDGKIWLIQKHAVAGVVQHEIAHSIHSYHWNGNMPSGGGIKHNFKQCYNGGLALTEGFADSMPYWVQFARNTAAPVNSYIGANLEKLGSGYCNGASNEGHVAATFWDVYDMVNDGNAPSNGDWNFTHAYAPVSTFLNNPGHNSMTEYMSVYGSILGPGMASRILDLFLLNTTIFP